MSGIGGILVFLRRVATSALVVAVLLALGFLGNSAVLTRDRHELAYNQQNLVRLHVVANSDSRADQAIKLKVRDALLAETRRLFLEVREAEQALRLADEHRGAIAALAAKVAAQEGAPYGARVEIGRFAFPAKSYPFGTLPAGEYQGVKVILGEGRGRNWWCVLFPPLCFETPQEEKAEEGPVRIRLLFLEELLAGQGRAMDAFWRGWAEYWSL